MSKQTTSQWDFGELFPTEATRKVLSVGELTEQIRRLLEKQVGTIWVTGEITNLRAQSSGHMYFTLKDANAQLSCVLFRNETVAHRELLADGQKVLLQGDITVYEQRGQYQLIVHAVELQGVGALQVAFEKLKQKLSAEGLFANERKRSLPRFPQRIGLVTSPTGAAIRDVLHVVQRRNPGLEVILVPCRVQGDGAAREVAAAIKLLNEFNVQATDSEKSAIGNRQSAIDLILVTRGGGSLEDLWAFNEEVVARAIFESEVPVVSAIGHEIDFTISDFVADIRAATPSAAAEIITEGMFSSSEFIGEAGQRLRQCVRKQFDDKVYELEQTWNRLARVHPRRKFNEWLQRLDDLQTGLSRSARQGTRSQRVALQHLFERLRLVRPSQILKQRKVALQALQSRLRLLGPEQVLARGYSITTDAATGKVLRDAAQMKAGQRLKTRLKKGEITSRAEK